jgi:hypothetical protein
MNYTGTLSVPIDEVARLERFCRVPPGRKNCNGRDVPLFDQEYTFPNGCNRRCALPHTAQLAYSEA